jgi:hypothetical protein
MNQTSVAAVTNAAVTQPHGVTVDARVASP